MKEMTRLRAGDKVLQIYGKEYPHLASPIIQKLPDHRNLEKMIFKKLQLGDDNIWKRLGVDAFPNLSKLQFTSCTFSTKGMDYCIDHLRSSNKVKRLRLEEIDSAFVVKIIQQAGIIESLDSLSLSTVDTNVVKALAHKLRQGEGPKSLILEMQYNIDGIQNEALSDLFDCLACSKVERLGIFRSGLVCIDVARQLFQSIGRLKHLRAISIRCNEKDVSPTDVNIIEEQLRVNHNLIYFQGWRSRFPPPSIRYPLLLNQAGRGILTTQSDHNVWPLILGRIKDLKLDHFFEQCSVGASLAEKLDAMYFFLRNKPELMMKR